MAEPVKLLRVEADVQQAQKRIGELTNAMGVLKNQKARLDKQMRQGKELTQAQQREYANLRKQIKSNQVETKKYANAVDIANGSMKRTSGFVMGIRKAMTGLAAQFLAFTAVIQVIRNVVGVFRDFEQANADLSAVLEVTGDDMKELTEDAKRLGATTAFTATEVSQLQKEFAKLGFSQEEILNATEATLDLAAATGEDLPRAAEVVGATVRAFGLDASETQRVTDVMAKSFSSSALDMEKFAVSMRAVAPVAKNAGLNIEQTTSMLGILVDRGIDASTAGTSLRNVFLELSKQGLTFEEAMEQINSSTDKNATALDLFGKRGAVTGTILAETGVQVSELETELNKAGGSARDMAEKQLDTLQGSLTILNSAWEGLILSMEDGGGFLADTLKIIIKDISTGLSNLSGNVDETEKKFSVVGTVLQVIKMNLALMIVPLREIIKGFITVGKALAEKFRPEIEAVTGFVETNVVPIFEKVASTIKTVASGILSFGEGALAKLGINVDLGAKAMSMFNEIVGVNTEQTKENTKAIEENNEQKEKAIQLTEQEQETNLTLKERIALITQLQIDEGSLFKTRVKGIEEIIEAEKNLREFQEEGYNIFAGETEEEIIEDSDWLVEQFRKTHEGKQQALEIALSNQEISQAQFNSEMAKLDAEELKRQENQAKLKQELKQKELQSASNLLGALGGLAEEGSATQKALMSAQALINTYAAITGQLAAFSTVPVPGYAIAQAIATGIMGFAQVAKINGVKFAQGGVLRGKSHARGGIPTIDGQYEFEGGEAVINKRSTARYGALLSSINQAGGGVAFEKGGITKFQDGGVTAPISFPDPGTDVAGVTEQLTAQMGAIKVVNVVSETTEQQNSILNVQSEAEFG